MTTAIDIPICLDRLGLNANDYRLDKSEPPHAIKYWDPANPDPQPTAEQLSTAWFEVQKGFKADEIDAAFARAKAASGRAGLTSSALGSPHSYQFNRDDLTYLQRVIAAGEGIEGLDAAGNQRGINCIDENGNPVRAPHTPAQVTQLEAEYWSAVQVMFAQFNGLKQAARAASTQGELDAIVT